MLLGETSFAFLRWNLSLSLLLEYGVAISERKVRMVQDSFCPFSFRCRVEKSGKTNGVINAVTLYGLPEGWPEVLVRPIGFLSTGQVGFRESAQ